MHSEPPAGRIHIDNIRVAAEEAAVFSRWLHILNEAAIPYVVGGAFAVYAYTGIWRDTKDLDVFLQPGDLKKALNALSKEGFETEVRDVYWLAKAHKRPYLMDLIFGTSSNQFPVDRSWFEHSQPTEIFGIRTQLAAVEELIASKVYMLKSNRFDGADIVHLIRCVQGRIDWQRVLGHLKDNWEILLLYLILFDFVYPSHSDYLPKELMISLFGQMREGWEKPKRPKAFRGMLLDAFMFAVDCREWDYENGCNLLPLVNERGEKI
ncbi:MAG: nucleotidyltransferase [bacterium]